MNAFKTGLFAVCVVVLAVCGVQLIQAHRAIDAWQAEVERLNDEVTRLEAEVERLESQAEQDYYRGIFDTWQWIAVASSRRVDSLNLVRLAHQADWYGQASVGWHWPLEGDDQPKSPATR